MIIVNVSRNKKGYKRIKPFMKKYKLNKSVKNKIKIGGII